MTRKTIFISTGEVSGDLQGALLIEGLKRQAESIGLDLEIVALGGEKMAASGATLLENTTGIGSVGILESLPFVVPTLQIQQRAKQYLRQHPPDLVVLIDYMGPNLSLGRFMRRHLPQVPIAYYIAPQDWVWSARSILPRDTMTIVKMTDQLLAVFPEEARYFEKKGASVTWVGHPLVDRMRLTPTREESRAALGIEPDQIAIALVPASRRQELKYMMPIAFEAARQLQAKLSETAERHKSNSQSPLFWIPLSLEAYRPAIEAAIERYGLKATLVSGQTQEVLSAADLAITKSGTVNLELALLNVPQVVFYRVSPFTYSIARLLKFSIPFMSPPNLVVMRSIVPELLQEEATAENIVNESLELLFNPERREQTQADYQEMRQLLGEVGVCDRAASEILKLVGESPEKQKAMGSMSPL
ncbi:lipid-A-disaccharide synthase [Allocoleopsis franciscana]|uniref:Lipid-A-disaccharide synthase n=1 Tax=Allocoleopsis franciscana PCC 7113 TaxID=1173027 RepID=K9WKN0_9CYAN|nr:lipid-A-disaccharide synthase [Allocoleopsis franciscana]AFZ20743.1 lipid-A-disaccharide synthase [Allocoleopsis franciscana PCC 7113]